jgi:hypothetical protein
MAFTHVRLPALLVTLLFLGCGSSRGTSTADSGGGGRPQGGRGGTSTASSAAGGAAGGSGGSSTSSPAQGGGSSSTAGATSGAAGGTGGASSTPDTGRTGGATSATGGMVSASGGFTGTGGSPGTGGRSEGRDAGSDTRDAGSDSRDAEPDARIDHDALPDVASERPAADAASIPGTNNPVLPGLYADPNIVVFDDTFYLYPTTDGVADWGATTFSVFSSKNLVQWTKLGVILDAAKDLTWAKGRAWAPGIARVGDTYYFYFSAEVQLGVATSKSPAGPFKDALGAPLVKAGQYAPQSIDPYVFIDDDGTRYLLFGSGGGGLRMAKLNADMISFAGTPSNISPSGASGTLEGAGMFKRKGTYYLYWSEGDTRNASYRMAYARAQAALGPFTRLATLLEQNTTLGILGPGGGTILAIPARDELYVAYHRFKIPGGDGTNRETCIDRLTVNSDGTLAPVKPTREGLQTAVAP